MEKLLKFFKGSTPPEIFIGRQGYPNIYSGILAPTEQGDTEKFSSPEIWFKEKLSIKEILEYRNQLLYARFKTNVKSIKNPTKLNSAVNQVALSKSSIGAEFKLKKPAKFSPLKETHVPLIGKPAPLEKIQLTENPKIIPKVEYISSDTGLKSQEAINNLYKHTSISNIIKILSAGLLGLKTQRKLVPTRWAITATDDTISKNHLKKIRYFKEINNYLLFNSEYLGNHYEILLLPDKYSFEVIEISLKDSGVWKDNEGFFPRKTYAKSVTGAYYANRLALTEYLLKTQRQASAIFLRQVSEEYTSPMGVGILREISRDALSKKPEKFETLKEALNQIQTRIKIPIKTYTEKSEVIKNFRKQTRLSKWF